MGIGLPFQQRRIIIKPTPFELLREFHETYGAAIDQPFTEDLIDLRMNLISEESREVEEEIDKAFPLGEQHLGYYEYLPFNPSLIDKKALTKELADLMYVTIGFATTFGLPLEEVFYEVHKSNMSKLGPDGEVLRREDGKILKGINYKEPDLDQFFS